MKCYGVREINLKLFSSYFENRKQSTEIDNVKSNSSLITTGVPQVSILERLLFIVYINDFAPATIHFNFLIYADDTTLKINKLSLNVVKYKYMIFKKKKKNIQTLNLKIDIIDIEQVTDYNFWV